MSIGSFVACRTRSFTLPIIKRSKPPFSIGGDGLKNLYSISILHQFRAYAGMITNPSRNARSFSHKNHKSQRLRRTQGSLAQHEGWQECKSPACHSERERRISHAGHPDSSLTLRMTMQSRFVSSPNHRISDEINCWSQNDTTKPIRLFTLDLIYFHVVLLMK